MLLFKMRLKASSKGLSSIAMVTGSLRTSRTILIYPARFPDPFEHFLQSRIPEPQSHRLLSRSSRFRRLLFFRELGDPFEGFWEGWIEFCRWHTFQRFIDTPELRQRSASRYCSRASFKRRACASAA